MLLFVPQFNLEDSQLEAGVAYHRDEFKWNDGHRDDASKTTSNWSDIPLGEAKH